MEVYYYIPVSGVSNAIECGLKLSAWYDKEVIIGGYSRKCMSALLNPKDDMKKYGSQELKCVKLELPPKYCFVADKYLYDTGINYPEVMDMYIDSIKPIEDYIFGSYRVPECLVTSTIIGGKVSVLDNRRDSPILFDNSEELYINNIIGRYKEEHSDFTDVMLYYFYCKLADCDKIKKIKDDENKVAVFDDGEKIFTVKIPDISGY